MRDEIGINQISCEEDETERDYFKRKIEVLKQAATPKDLIIIDNFDVDADEDLETCSPVPVNLSLRQEKISEIIIMSRSMLTGSKIFRKS